MPPKLEKCVESIMQKQGLSESRAYAICMAATDSLHDGISYDAQAGFKATLDQTTGFLKAPVTLARVGVQHYMGLELGIADRAMDKIGVFRPSDEVFHSDSLTSFENMVITDDHPSRPVTVDNVKELQVGQVSNIKNDGTTISGIATITDKDIIKKIQDGKSEVSVGYGHELRKESGQYQGQDYEFVQTDIRGNHLAVVQAGRCGPSCKITTDDKGGIPMIITIDGIEYETDNKQLAQAVTKLQASKDAEKEEFKKKMEDEEEEKEKAIKEKEKAEAAKDALANDALSDDALNKLVATRAKLIADAAQVIGDKMPDCGCPNKVMAAVVDHVYPDMSLDGKSKDYVAAAYDMAILKFNKEKGSMDQLKEDFITDKDGKEVTRDSARTKYAKDQLGLEV